MDVFEFLDNAEQIDSEWLEKEIIQFLIENEILVVDMIKSQWEQGENEDGVEVGRYKESTENFYAKINPPASGMPKIAGQPYNLMWDGSLIRQTGINLEIKGGDLIMTVDSTAGSKNPLFTQIRKESLVPEPESIFGLQEFNLGKVTEMSEENLVERFYQTLKLE